MGVQKPPLTPIRGGPSHSNLVAVGLLQAGGSLLVLHIFLHLRSIPRPQTLSPTLGAASSRKPIWIAKSLSIHVHECVGLWGQGLGDREDLASWTNGPNEMDIIHILEAWTFHTLDTVLEFDSYRFIGMHRNAPLSPMKRVPGCTTPMKNMAPMAPMHLVEKIRA